MQPADGCFVGQCWGDDIDQAPGVAFAGLFTILRQNREAVAGENTVALALLLAVIHVAEERVCLGPDVEVNASYILVFIERVRVLKVDLLLVAKAVVKGGVVKGAAISLVYPVEFLLILGYANFIISA